MDHPRKISSIRNTAAQLATATSTRLFFRKASSTATARPTRPLRRFSVAYKIAGKVMAVKLAAGI